MSGHTTDENHRTCPERSRRISRVNQFNSIAIDDTYQAGFSHEALKQQPMGVEQTKHARPMGQVGNMIKSSVDIGFSFPVVVG